jgi:RNA polymerase sigma-70 factor (ECF subfamily)
MNPTRHGSPVPENASHEPPTCDEALVLAARAGCHAAFADLQKIHSRRLFNCILSITRNYEDAEDALQDTFFRAFRALPSFEGRSKFSTWLTRIAINSALMMIRRRRARPEVSSEQPDWDGDCDIPFEVPASAPNPEEICDQNQRSQALLNAIDRLSPKLRDPLRIWVEEEHSMDDLAQELGVSVASIKARLHRARKRLSRSQALRGRDAGSAGTLQAPQKRRESLAPSCSSIPERQSLPDSQSAESVNTG